MDVQLIEEWSKDLSERENFLRTKIKIMESQIDGDKLVEVLKEIKPTPYCVSSVQRLSNDGLGKKNEWFIRTVGKAA